MQEGKLCQQPVQSLFVFACYAEQVSKLFFRSAGVMIVARAAARAFVCVPTNHLLGKLFDQSKFSMKKRSVGLLYRIRNMRRRTKIILFLLLLFLMWFWFCLPQPLFNTPSSYVIEASNGDLMGATIATDGQWRFPYNDAVPDKFRDCIVTFEDKRFFYHPGVDPIAMVRALRQNIRSGSRISGGSTLSMQVIRLARNQPRNIWHKVVESLMAIRLEFRYSKKNILALYASHAPFGSNVVGLDAAAWRYFGRNADHLSWGEMAALAVLPNSPGLVHPGRNRDRLMQKRNSLLDKLLGEGIIDSSTCYLSKMEPLPDAPKPLPQLAPHLLQRFRKERRKGTSSLLRSTLSRPLQETVNQVTEQHHNILKGNGINNICALVLEVETGNALAYVGNAYHPEDPALQSHVDVINSLRSPGSTLKPVLYAAMLNDGLLLPHSLVPDIPTQIGGYTPQNFDYDYDGAVPASRALSRSLNVPAVRMLRDYKYQRFYDNLKRIGISTLNRPAGVYGLSLVLGGCEVTPWELGSVYAGMARSLLHTPKNKDSIDPADFHPASYNREEKIIQRSQAINFLDPVSIWYMFQSMEEVMRPGEEGLWRQFSSSQRVAWKTGTSFGFRDAWAVGVTPRHVVVVWVGNGSGEGRPGLIGVQAAAPVMFDIIKSLPHAGWFEQPQVNNEQVPVCRHSGMRAGTDCMVIDSLAVPLAGAHSPQCKYHTKLHLDEAQQYRVNESCFSPSRMVTQSWFILPPVMEWYYRRRHFDYQPAPPYKPDCMVAGSGKIIDLVYPEQNAKIYIPLDLSGERSNVVFIAAHQRPGTKIHWHIDDRFVTTTTNFHQIAVAPSPGKHFVTVVDENGERMTRQFEILDARKEQDF